jgi:hypothetical protein
LPDMKPICYPWLVAFCTAFGRMLTIVANNVKIAAYLIFMRLCLPMISSST